MARRAPEIATASTWASRSARALLVVWALCAALLAAAVWPQVARADGSVTYEQRSYSVQIQQDGSVQVTEHWQAHFSGGPFHHAFLALYLAKTAGITFGTVRGDQVTNQQISETTDAAGNPMEQVAWDFPETSDATREFDIPYTIQGALGIGTTQAWLDWHFLDGGSPTGFPVNAAEVRVTLPDATDANSLTVSVADSGGELQKATPDARTVVVTGQQLTSNVPLEVEVAFPRTQIAASVARPAWQSTDTPPTLPTALGTGQPAGSTGGANPGPYIPDPGAGGYTAPSGEFSNLVSVLMSVLGPLLLVCGSPLLLLILSALGLGRKGGGWGYGNRLGANRAGPWYRGPWTQGGGPWTGGSGFGGGGFGGGGGGSGGGGGGGASGFS